MHIVGIDEYEIKTRAGRQDPQGVERRTLPEHDLLAMRACSGSMSQVISSALSGRPAAMLSAETAPAHPCARGTRASLHSVAGERADLQHPLGAGNLHQHSQECPFHRAGEHLRQLAVRLRVGGQFLQ